jgi:hypothetical protein
MNAHLMADDGHPVPQAKPLPHLNDSVKFGLPIQRIARILRTVVFTAVAAITLVLAWLARRLSSRSSGSECHRLPAAQECRP